MMKPELAARTAVVVCLTLLAIAIRSCYIPERDMVGLYVSNDNEPRAEFPQYGEKLRLLSDRTYERGSLGFGSWQMLGRELLMMEGKMEDMVSYSYSVRRRWIVGPPKIILNSDMLTFYEKVE